jgi:mRNA interferase MazF
LATFVKGDVVVVPFPFSDLSQAKRRPALVVAVLEGDDLVLCQITSQAVRDKYAIALVDKDFAVGGLRQKSNIRPNRLFTADQRIVLYKAGQLATVKLREVIRKIVDIVQR